MNKMSNKRFIRIQDHNSKEQDYKSPIKILYSFIQSKYKIKIGQTFKNVLSNV